MNKRLIFPVLIIFTVLSGCSPEQDQAGSAGNIATVDSLIRHAIDQDHIPGAVLRIQKEDSILHFKPYGYAQKFSFGLRPMDQPEIMTRNHLFDLASLTKVFATTFGIMQLIDRQKLALDDPVHTYLPDFSEGDKRRITIRHLLTHSSGLPQWYPLYYLASNRTERRDAIAALSLKWPVGEDRHYSDLGFMLLGDVIEEISGKPLNSYLEEQLYSTLDLEHTLYKPLDSGITKIAATSHGNPFEKKMVYDDEFGYNVDVDPYSWQGWRTYTLRGEVNDGNAWYANEGVAGHAGLFSTAGDLQVLVNLLLDKGKLGDTRFISQAVIDTFLTRNQYGNGLGWAMEKSVISAEGTPQGTFGHTGFTGTNVVVIPEYNLSVILLTNRQHVGQQEDGTYFNLNPIRQEIISILMQEIDNG